MACNDFEDSSLRSGLEVARQMSSEREREFVELSGYVDYVATHVMQVDPASPVHPTNVLKGIG